MDSNVILGRDMLVSRRVNPPEKLRYPPQEIRPFIKELTTGFFVWKSSFGNNAKNDSWQGSFEVLGAPVSTHSC